VLTRLEGTAGLGLSLVVVPLEGLRQWVRGADGSGCWAGRGWCTACVAETAPTQPIITAAIRDTPRNQFPGLFLGVPRAGKKNAIACPALTPAEPRFNYSLLVKRERMCQRGL
jgi:hypothetical protein